MAISGGGERGAVYTRRPVVDFILDLAGYTTDRPLHEMRLLEPSAGGGDFLIPAIERLLIAWANANRPPVVLALKDAIQAVELHRESAAACFQAVTRALRKAGISTEDARYLAGSWLRQGDFLLAELDGTFDVIIGNPPYVRQEMVPDALMAEYRRRFSTIYDRADLYVPFIERSLHLLGPEGRCAFICSDRWMKNKYGGPLRSLIAQHFHLAIHVDMVGVDAFHADVVAYPAITVMEPAGKAKSTRVARCGGALPADLLELTRHLMSDATPALNTGVQVLKDVAIGSAPWILEASDGLDLVRRLEAKFPSLEAAGCKVGIGVATGADAAFIGPFDELDVEPSRKLPLAMTRDLTVDGVAWRGLGVINPFGDDGKLVDLAAYPRLKRYLELRREQIAGRHVAQKTPNRWYRTIDRIYPDLAKTPKLLIPDIKGEAQVVYEGGRLYPHHNLYFITSETWHLRALQAVLMSGIARLFVAAYSTKMRGGYLRFQAQYLRRIRLPSWPDVPDAVKNKLIAAADRGDVDACNNAVSELYELTPADTAALRG
ncbi:MAG: N-6 DNA methylase [Rhizobiaceae bacterium]|nr:N-6 DNA methylase [Rhizobiaceae bacterium]